jgi:GntR family transcriptional regulator, transcriptional repressor for pyruvate dehydrogenase complex
MYSIRDSSRIPVHTRDEYAYDQLLALIGSNDFGADARLPSELALAERFGVSRPVLRQALARLRSEGRIYSRKGSGNYVSSAAQPSALLSFSTLGSIPDVRAFLEFRMSVEGECAACAAAVGDRVAIAKLKKIQQRLTIAFEHEKSGIDDDIAFHMTIAQATRNRFFAHAVGALLEQMQFSIRLVRELTSGPAAPRRRRVIDEHDDIVRAIDCGDAEAARTAMRAHLAAGIARLFESEK